MAEGFVSTLKTEFVQRRVFATRLEPEIAVVEDRAGSTTPASHRPHYDEGVPRADAGEALKIARREFLPSGTRVLYDAADG